MSAAHELSKSRWETYLEASSSQSQPWEDNSGYQLHFTEHQRRLFNARGEDLEIIRVVKDDQSSVGAFSVLSHHIDHIDTLIEQLSVSSFI